MTPSDESLERAAELDRLIELRRAGELRGDDVPAWALPLAELAADLGALGREVITPDEDVVWSRVAGEVAAESESGVAGTLADVTSLQVLAGLDNLVSQSTLPDEDVVWLRVSAEMGGGRVVEGGSTTEPWWRVGPFGRRPLLWGPAGAAAAVVIAIALMLAQPPVNTAEAFVRDVEALSTLAEAALADGVLTADEKDSVADLATGLRLAVDARPETLIELDAETRGSVLATLAEVTASLTPIADEELVALRGGPPPGLATAIESVDSGPNGAPVASGATEGAVVSEEATPKPAEDVPGRGIEVRSGSTPSEPPDVGHVAPVVASSVTSLNEVAEAVEGAGRGDASPRASLATPGYLAGLCRELRGQERSGCQRAINGAIAACAGAADRDERDDCADALAFASEVCEAVLPEAEATLCAEALAGLDVGDEIGASRLRDGANRGKIDGSADDDDDGMDSPPDDDRKDREDDD